MPLAGLSYRQRNLPSGAAEVLCEAEPPEDVAVLHLEAGQVTAHAQDVEPFSVDRRRAGRTFLGLRHTLLEGRPKAGHRHLLAVLLVQYPDDFVISPIGHPEDAARGDRRGAVPAAEPLGLPGERRAVLRPLLEEAFLLGDAVPVGALPLWPVVGTG